MSATLVRNLMPGPTVLTPDPSSQEFIRWEGVGDPEGGDVQLVSTAAAESVPFARALARQIIVMEDVEDGHDAPVMSEGVRAYLARQNDLAAAAREAAEAKIAATVVRETDKDILGVACIGPNTRGNGPCGELARVSSADKDGRPPLCERHKSLASQYIREDTGVVTTGEGESATAKAQTRWIRVGLGARERDLGA